MKGAMAMQKRNLTALALAATVLAASGCGESSKSSSQTATTAQVRSSAQTTPATQTQPPSATPPLTTAELIAKADPICALLDARRSANKVRTKQDYIRIFREMSPYEQQTISQLSALTPPTSLASTWSRVIAGYKTINANLTKAGEALTNGQEAAAASLLNKSIKLDEQTAALAKQHGFKDCGESH
jgi:hypothetical protein